MSASDQLTLDHIVTHRAALLGALHSRQGVVRDYVRAVARGYATGLYLWGRPGTAKTHTVRAVLEREVKEVFAYERGHLTPMGLFELIAEHPDETIVLDDLTEVLRSPVALQVLLSALEGPAGEDRRVVYRRQRRVERVTFCGGVVCVSNLELHDGDVLAAFRSRVHTLQYDPTDAQLGALMLSIAEAGWPAARPTVTGGEAGEVARFLIGVMLGRGCRFDLRLLLEKALPLYQQVKDGEAESDWRDLVTAAVDEHLVEAREERERPAGRAARLEEDRATARDIAREFRTREERARAWAERTGKSERAFYRRLAELQ